jgi:hypothetical protein
VTEGEEGAELYVVTFGSVRLYSRANGIDVVLHEQNSFGELSLLSAEPLRRRATATALSFVSASTLSRDDFMEILKLFDDNTDRKQVLLNVVLRLSYEMKLEDLHGIGVEPEMLAQLVKSTLHGIFDQFDADNSGALSKSELETMMGATLSMSPANMNKVLVQMHGEDISFDTFFCIIAGKDIYSLAKQRSAGLRKTLQLATGGMATVTKAATQRHTGATHPRMPVQPVTKSKILNAVEQLLGNWTADVEAQLVDIGNQLLETGRRQGARMNGSITGPQDSKASGTTSLQTGTRSTLGQFTAGLNGDALAMSGIETLSKYLPENNPELMAALATDGVRHVLARYQHFLAGAPEADTAQPGSADSSGRVWQRRLTPDMSTELLEKRAPRSEQRTSQLIERSLEQLEMLERTHDPRFTSMESLPEMLERTHDPRFTSMESLPSPVPTEPSSPSRPLYADLSPTSSSDVSASSSLQVAEHSVEQKNDFPDPGLGLETLIRDTGPTASEPPGTSAVTSDAPLQRASTRTNLVGLSQSQRQLLQELSSLESSDDDK